MVCGGKRAAERPGRLAPARPAARCAAMKVSPAPVTRASRTGGGCAISRLQAEPGRSRRANCRSRKGVRRAGNWVCAPRGTTNSLFKSFPACSPAGRISELIIARIERERPVSPVGLAPRSDRPRGNASGPVLQGGISVTLTGDAMSYRARPAPPGGSLRIKIRPVPRVSGDDSAGAITRFSDAPKSPF